MGYLLTGVYFRGDYCKGCLLYIWCLLQGVSFIRGVYPRMFLLQDVSIIGMSLQGLFISGGIHYKVVYNKGYLLQGIYYRGCYIGASIKRGVFLVGVFYRGVYYRSCFIWAPIIGDVFIAKKLFRGVLQRVSIIG